MAKLSLSYPLYDCVIENDDHHPIPFGSGQFTEFLRTMNRLNSAALIDSCEFQPGGQDFIYDIKLKDGRSWHQDIQKPQTDPDPFMQLTADGMKFSEIGLLRDMLLQFLACVRDYQIKTMKITWA